MISAWPRIARWIALSGSVALCISGFSQNLTLVDSLKNELRKALPENQFRILNGIGFEYRYSFPDSTILYCSKAYELGKQLKLEKELSRPLSFIGLANANKGDYKKSLDFHYQSIEVAIQQNDSVQLAFAYNNLGRMFLDEGDLDRAYENLVRSKDLFEMINNKSGLAYVYRSLSNLFKSQKDFTRALEMATRSLEIRKSMTNARELAAAYMELGLVYKAMNETPKALSKFATADSIAARINDKVAKAEVRLGIAEVLMQEGKPAEAFEIATRVLTAISDSTNRKLFLRSSLIRGRYFFLKGDDRKAIPILEDIVSDQKNRGTPFFQQDACNLLYEIYKRRKDDSRAREYLARSRQFDEMLQVQDLTNRIERLQFQVDIEKKERENALLKAKQSDSESLIAKQRSQNTLLVISVISIAGLALILYTSGRRRRLINHKLALQNQQIYYQREEITKQNERLSQRNGQLSELNNEKNTLMNIVAHDLKSPLNRIFGLAGLMEMAGSLDKEQGDYLKLIRSSTRAGLDMIKDLLDVNALEEAGSNPQYAVFDLNEILVERVKSLQIAADAKQITLKLSNPGDGRIRSDPDYINRILDNLISNAIKFSPKSTQVSISSQCQDHHAILSVSDQGPGFSDEDRKMIYQKFKKLSARPTGGESSNGLGLAIVKTLVERLGGTIALDTHRGAGSTFTISIPTRDS